MLSILITHYNRPDALRTCLRTIQEIKWKIPYEIIVTDDCSNPESLNKLKKLPIDTLLISQKNVGLAANLNKGIKACKGEFLLYCQEDALLLPKITTVLDESFSLLNSNRLDMIRLRANYKFPELIKLTENISKIPRFSFKNFMVNTFQYSDNPFITKTDFFNKYGYFLEGTSGPYGETEYAIRILNTSAKIGITHKKYAIWQAEVESVINKQIPIKKRKYSKKMLRFARAVRQHFEWILYSKNNRKLYTYKNHRK